MTLFKKSLLTATTLSCLALGSSQAGIFSSGANTEQINQAIHQYIEAHPDEILDAVIKGQQKKIEQEQEKAKSFVKDNIAEIEKIEGVPFIGNKDGKFTVVQFFDYRCGHCKSSSAVMGELLANNPDAKVVYRNLAILGPDSVLAAQASLAVHKLYPALYPQFHRDLLAEKTITQNEIDALLMKYSMDKKAIEKEMKSEEINKMLDDNRQLAMKIGVRGVPAYIVDGELQAGSVNYEMLKSKYQQKQKDSSAAGNGGATEPKAEEKQQS